MPIRLLQIACSLFLLWGCAPQLLPLPQSTYMTEEPAPDPTEANKLPTPKPKFADVLSINVTGESGSYQFAVEVSSPDTGCEQYADWWEVLSEDGQLLYRRVLLHSHVSEQPFTRSGGPVKIKADTVVFVRAHMNTVGYGGLLMVGTAQGGFNPVDVETGFGSRLERVPPLPEDCAF